MCLLKSTVEGNMQIIKLMFISIFIILVSIQAYAEGIRVTLNCTDVEYVEIRKTSPGAKVSGNFSCNQDCFYFFYYLTDGSARNLDQRLRAHENDKRELYIEERHLYTIPPTSGEYMDVYVPYTRQIFIPKMYNTCQETVHEIMSVCPGITLRINSPPPAALLLSGVNTEEIRSKAKIVFAALALLIGIAAILFCEGLKGKFIKKS